MFNRVYIYDFKFNYTENTNIYGSADTHTYKLDCDNPTKLRVESICLQKPSSMVDHLWPKEAFLTNFLTELGLSKDIVFCWYELEK